MTIGRIPAPKNGEMILQATNPMTTVELNELLTRLHPSDIYDIFFMPYGPTECRYSAVYFVRRPVEGLPTE